jgi:hypothetical protein
MPGSMLFQNQLRRFGGDFFNLHAARRRRHEHRLALRAIEHDAQIQLALDGQRLFDQQALHDAAFRTGLVRHQRHAQHLARDSAASAASFATFTPPPLPRPPAWICAFTTTLPPIFLAAASASSTVNATSPRGTGTLYWPGCLGLILVNFHVPMPPAECARAIREIGIGFLFAPAIHTATKHAHRCAWI